MLSGSPSDITDKTEIVDNEIRAGPLFHSTCGSTVLADILIWLALFGIVKEDHLVTSKLFGTVLYTINPDSGE